MPDDIDESDAEEFDPTAYLDSVLTEAGRDAAPLLRTPAWLLVGITRSLPGALQLVGSRLSFTTDLFAVFDVECAEVERVAWPRYYFGGGAKIAVGGEMHRISFVKPNGAADTSTRLLIDRLGAAGGGLAIDYAIEKFRDVGDGRERGRAWREVLDAALAEA